MPIESQRSDDCTTCAEHELICLPDTQVPRIVIIGGGFAGLSLIKGLKNQNFQIVLLDQNNFHQFQPLLYQVATSGLEPDSILFPFRKQISEYSNVIFRMAKVKEVQTSTKTVITNRGIIQYDYLVVATGTSNNYFGMQQLEQQSLGLKTIHDALNIRHRMLQNLEQAAISCDQQERDALTTFAIVGGGPAGVEMAGALDEFCNYILPKDYPEYSAASMKIYLVEASGQVLPMMSEKASIKTFKFLQSLRVKVLLNEVVTGYNGLSVTTRSKRVIATRNMIWTAGVKGQYPLGLTTENNTSRGNRLMVDSSMEIIDLKDVFAIGDVAAMITKERPHGHPQVAQPAIQQGSYLAQTLVNRVNKRPNTPFVYHDKGALATVGKRKAVADIGRLKFGGYIAWLLWSLVHIMSISGFRNRILVSISWMMSYFSYEKSNRLILTDLKPLKPPMNGDLTTE